MKELYQQTLDLRRQLAELTAKQRMVWALFIDASRKLQISSASIKAAVSSLLNYDIFWDGANQHEFLTTINSSVDQAAKLASLLTLAVRSEAGSLETQTRTARPARDHFGCSGRRHDFLPESRP